MVWGLFAAAPAIARIRSRTYQESVWCRRELELTENDFLTKRWIIDLEESDLGRLDSIVKAWNRAVLIGPPSSLPEFPPVIEVCSPSLMPVWEIRMLRASAALRLIHAWFRGVAHRSR